MLSDTEYKKTIEKVTKAYGKVSAVTHAVGPFSEKGADQLNKKRTIGYISLNLKDSPSELSIEEHKGSSTSTVHSGKPALTRRLSRAEVIQAIDTALRVGRPDGCRVHIALYFRHRHRDEHTYPHRDLKASPQALGSSP